MTKELVIHFGEEPHNQQEINLHENWKHRQSSSTIIATKGDVDVVRCVKYGKDLIFYAVRNNVPLGYVSCLYDSIYRHLTVASTYFSPIHQRQGLGTLVYETIVETEGSLNSDYELTEGARALWEKLMRNNKITVGPGVTEGSFLARNRS